MIPLKRSAVQADRLFLMTLGGSLVGHALALGASCMSSGWNGVFTSAKFVKLIYEPETIHEPSRRSKDLDRGDATLRELPGPSSNLSIGSFTSGYSPRTTASDVLAYAAHARIGGDSPQHWTSLTLHESGAWAAAVDLTNLRAASQGNPTFYSYYGAIREQIQRTANTQGWLPQQTPTAGIVYVGFVIDHAGAIRSATVLFDRSVDSPVLREAALRIVRASGPFLPFPPSFQESSKAIVIPIEFAVGSL